MEFKQKNFIPLLFAGDINSYSMARAFYEAYKIKSIVYGKYFTGPNCNSRIVDYRNEENLEKESTFLKIVNTLAEENPEKKILLIGCADSYVELASKLRVVFRENVIVVGINYEKMKEVILKESFYSICKKFSLDFPKTVIYSKEEDIKHGLDYPVIVKPSNSVMYWENKFEGQKKVYKVGSGKEILGIVNHIYESGYRDKLIIQEFIPGDDSYMYVLTGYCDKEGEVKLMALGNVLMEEHTPRGLGNHSVIINEVNEDLCKEVSILLKGIGYVGYFNFDIKYDSRDGRYKFLELNIRQGRSNYYVTGAGYNLAKYVVDDYIYDKEIEYTLATNKKLWLVIPLVLALIFVKSKKYRKEMLSLILLRRVIHPVFFMNDMGFMRFLRFFKTHMSHFKKIILEK
jgi:D-aspartate ligase